jgi:hypothetical protein
VSAIVRVERVVDWRCERCGRPATTLTVDGVRAIGVARERRRRDEARAAHGVHAVTLREFLADHVEGEHWVVACDGCLTGPELERGYYWLDTSRIATPAQALAWTVHLFETKGWLDATDWLELMRRVVLQPEDDV